MLDKKREHPLEKTLLHPRNKHRNRYNFTALIKSCPELAPFVKPNKYNDLSIDFFNSEAVKTLNKALLVHFYDIQFWDIPPQYLCPPIPGRADYIHYIADILAETNPLKEIPKGQHIKCLDIGTGANCIYPILGIKEYNWSFVGTDIDQKAIASGLEIIKQNSNIKDAFSLRHQPNIRDVFQGIIKENEFFDITICNPPFHESLEAAQTGNIRKNKNLQKNKTAKASLNFGGQRSELWCLGGEEKFVRDLVYQSRQFASSCLWFSTLISKESNLRKTYKMLNKVGAIEIKTVNMKQGNKKSRIVVWSFLSKAEQNKWTQNKWQF